MADEMVAAGEIRWRAEPQRRLEALPVDDLLTLELVDVLDYTVRLQYELQAVRALGHASLGVVVDLTNQIDRLKQTVVRLHEALREQRAA